MTNDLVPYTRLDSIIKQMPRKDSLSRTSFSSHSSLDYHQALNELEKRVFQEKQKGSFIVFHSSVVGMASVYRVPKTCTNDEYNQQYRAGRGHQFFPARIGFARDLLSDKNQVWQAADIQIPDKTILKDLEFALPDAQKERLIEFYKQMADRSYHQDIIRLPPDLVIFANRDEANERHYALNNFSDDLGVYHNGVKINRRHRFALESGDIVRLGPSIIFGYIQK